MPRRERGSGRTVGRGLRWPALLLLPLLVACGGGEEEEPPESMQTNPEYRGLSREQIEAEATPMTQAEAESLGIVDTTIRIQPPMNPDSVLPLDSVILQQ